MTTFTIAAANAASFVLAQNPGETLSLIHI